MTQVTRQALEKVGKGTAKDMLSRLLPLAIVFSVSDLVFIRGTLFFILPPLK